MNVISIYLDTETKPGYGGDWEIEELGCYDPSRTEESLKSWKIRTLANDTVTPTFPEVFKKAVSWIERYKNEEDTILLVCHNRFDINVIKNTCSRFTLSFPSHWKTFDTVPLFRRVIPTRMHKLQYLRLIAGVKAWVQHRADEDAKGLHSVLAKVCDTQTIFKSCQNESTSLDIVSKRILSQRKVIPIFYDFTLSRYMKKEKFEDYPETNSYPKILKIDGYCPYRSDNQRFSTFINPGDDVEIDPEYSQGIQKEDLEGQPTFRKAISRFRKWSQGCLEGHVIGKVAHVAYNNFKLHNKILDLECETHFGCKYDDVILNNEDLIHKNVVHFDLSYFKSCLVHGFPRKSIWEKGKDKVFDDVLEYFKIPTDGDCLDKTHQLYEAMIGSADRHAVGNALLQKPNIKAVAEVVKPHFVPRPTVPYPIFADTETTGLPPKRGEKGDWPRIVQVAGFAPLKKKENQWFKSSVNPGILIPAEATDIHGITDADVKDAHNWSKIGSDYYDWALDGVKAWMKPVFIFHNANFDWYVIARENKRMSVTTRSDMKFFCTYQLSRVLRGGTYGHKLENLAEAFGIDHQEAHDAKGDVATTFEVFKKLIEPLSPDEAYNAIHLRENPRSSKEVAHKIQEALEGDGTQIVSITSGKRVVSKRPRDEGCSTDPAQKKKARTKKSQEPSKRAASEVKLRRSARLKKKRTV
ncbi:MAG: DNA polymerase III PolC-type [Chlamydiae bacterium]|nr:DNA polymerase III PolC-type [Chlamydiota bacterium]